MDDPHLDRSRHFAALNGLARLNWLSLSDRILWRPIAQFASERKVSRLRVLDVATGAGDLPLRLWHLAQRANLTLELHGVDISPQALEYARQNAERANATIKFTRSDVLHDELPSGYDIVLSSLFFHHLDHDQSALLLRKMTAATSSLVLINDLRRSVTGWMLAHAAARLFTTSPVVHFDAPVSVRAAFTIEEIRSLATSIGLEGFTVDRRWPCRFLLIWRRPVHGVARGS